MEMIGVLDCNNFFVSCERLFRPDLLGKPVAVLSSNDGCIVARSKEIKDMGIPMGVPYFQVKDTLTKAKATLFSAHFALYRDISKRVFQIVKDRCATLEQYSIDEAFFRLEVASVAEAEAFAYELKQEVERLSGIPVSIGIGTSKTIAKYASTRAKKGNGVMVYDREAWLALTPTIPIGELWGVGRRLNRRFELAQISTVAGLVACPVASIQSQFGVVGARLRAEVSGQVAYPVSTQHTIAQSIMSTRSFGVKTNDLAVIKDALAYHVRHVSAEVRSLGCGATQIAVMLLTSRHGDYVLRGGVKTHHLTTVEDDSAVLLKTALDLLGKLYEPGVPYQKVGCVLRGITPTGVVTPSLFAVESTSSVSALMDEINGRFGVEMMQVGRFKQAKDWRPKQEHISPAYTTQWTQLARVRA
jgi:DNA polymerase V